MKIRCKKCGDILEIKDVGEYEICVGCLNLYNSGEYEKIKLRKK